MVFKVQHLLFILKKEIVLSSNNLTFFLLNFYIKTIIPTFKFKTFFYLFGISLFINAII